MVSRETLSGLHHVTALAGDPQRNLDFYQQLPGIRLLKRTVNFDDPAAYHFYFGGATGTPGSLITFFPWATSASPNARRGIPGAGQIIRVGVEVPLESAQQPQDPDGIDIDFIPGPAPRLRSLTLNVADRARSLAFLREVLRFAPDGADSVSLPDGSSILVEEAENPAKGKLAAGVIHHAAFRVADEAAQLEWRERLIAADVRVSPVKDRLYFHSIYFREPGGILLEIATDGPGFEVDESAGELGQHLCLPPWLEPAREGIERRLPKLAESGAVRG